MHELLLSWQQVQNDAQQTAHAVVRRLLQKEDIASDILRVRAENDQAVIELLSKIDFRYGFGEVIADERTQVVLQDGQLRLVTEPSVLFEEVDGKIVGRGTCVMEASMKSALINATVQGGPVVAPYRMTDEETPYFHVRVDRIDTDESTALLSALDPQRTDASRAYRHFVRTDEQVPAVGLYQTLPSGDAEVNLGRGVLSLQIDPQTQEVESFASRGNVIDETSDGIPITLAVTEVDGKSYIFVQTLEESATYCLICMDGEGKKNMGVSYDPSAHLNRQCVELGRMICRKLLRVE